MGFHDIEMLEGWDLYERVILEDLLAARRVIRIATANLKFFRIQGAGMPEPRSIGDVLGRLVHRGVAVRILHAAVPTEPWIDFLRESDLHRESRFSMRRCPRVHFKAIIVDDTLLYTGSANMTGAGIGMRTEDRRNFELGIRTQDADLIKQTRSLFDVVWDGFMCDGCGKKDVCPVPLEEPDFD